MQEVEMVMERLLQTAAWANKLLNVSIALGIIAFLISVGCLVWLVKHENT